MMASESERKREVSLVLLAEDSLDTEFSKRRSVGWRTRTWIAGSSRSAELRLIACLVQNGLCLGLFLNTNLQLQSASISYHRTLTCSSHVCLGTGFFTKRFSTTQCRKGFTLPAVDVKNVIKACQSAVYLLHHVCK